MDASRDLLIEALKTYGCQIEDMYNMSDFELEDHLREHQFDAAHGEWPEDP